ncbi:hypothetical protein H0H93_014664, partial [Arthromyces matolae]
MGTFTSLLSQQNPKLTKEHRQITMSDNANITPANDADPSPPVVDNPTNNEANASSDPSPSSVDNPTDNSSLWRLIGLPIPPVDYDNPQTGLYMEMQAEWLAAVEIMQSRLQVIHTSRGLPDNTLEVEAIYDTDLADINEIMAVAIEKLAILSALLVTIQ